MSRATDTLILLVGLEEGLEGLKGLARLALNAGSEGGKGGKSSWYDLAFFSSDASSLKHIHMRCIRSLSLSSLKGVETTGVLASAVRGVVGQWRVTVEGNPPQRADAGGAK